MLRQIPLHRQRGGGQRLQRRRHGLAPRGRAHCGREQRGHPRRLAYSSDSLSWAQWRAQSSAHRFLHERADLRVFGGSQLLQREGGRPYGAFVEVRLVHEAERRVPRLESLRALEEADDLAVLGIRGHPVPESRREGWRVGFDDGMEPLADGAIRFRHLGDLREHGAFPVRLVLARAAARGRLQLLDALLHRDSFLFRESLGRLADRGAALGGLLRTLLCSFHGWSVTSLPRSRFPACPGPRALPPEEIEHRTQICQGDTLDKSGWGESLVSTNPITTRVLAPSPPPEGSSKAGAHPSTLDYGSKEEPAGGISQTRNHKAKEGGHTLAS